MTYTVSILRRAQKELQRIAQEDYERVYEAMHALAHNPRPTGCLALAGRAGWRIRVGDYRIIYEIDAAQHTVTISRPSCRKVWTPGGRAQPQTVGDCPRPGHRRPFRRHDNVMHALAHAMFTAPSLTRSTPRGPLVALGEKA